MRTPADYEIRTNRWVQLIGGEVQKGHVSRQIGIDRAVTNLGATVTQATTLIDDYLIRSKLPY